MRNGGEDPPPCSQEPASLLDGLGQQNALSFDHNLQRHLQRKTFRSASESGGVHFHPALYNVCNLLCVVAHLKLVSLLDEHWCFSRNATYPLALVLVSKADMCPTDIELVHTLTQALHVQSMNLTKSLPWELLFVWLLPQHSLWSL